MTARKAKPVEVEERAIVAPPSDMDDQTFVKHFNARHVGPGGYNGAPVDIVGSWSDQIATFRAYHRQAHEAILGHVLNHDHVRGNQSWQDPQRGTE